MTGKIIDFGLIGADNGKRYVFDKFDVVNLLDLQSMKSLIGASVDFQVQNERAVSVYITQIKPNLTHFAERYVSTIWRILDFLLSFGSFNGVIIMILGVIALACWFVSVPLAVLFVICNVLRGKD